MPFVSERFGQSDERVQGDVSIRRSGELPQQFHVGIGVPAECDEVERSRRFDQPKPTDAGQTRTLGRGFGHAHDGSAGVWPGLLQRQILPEFERSHVAAVLLPLCALVAQEVIENVLPQCLSNQF